MKSVFKTNNYISILSFTLLLNITFSLQVLAQKHRMNKEVSETYDVGQNDELEISNRFGNVTINTWNQRKVAVNVNIEAWGKSEDKVKEILERISIEHGKSGNTISFETQISSKGWNNMNGDKQGYKINYTVNMPDNMKMDLSNKYGRISMPDFKGELDLSVAYGKVHTGELLGPDNDISVKYSGGSSFKAISNGNVYLRYSSGVEIGKVGNIELSDRYGGLTIDEAEKVEADIAYTSLKIGTLHKALIVESDYSSGKIENVKAGFEELRIDTSYGSYSVGFDSNANFDFEVESRYGGFKNRLSNVELKREYIRGTSSEHEGHRGKSGKGVVKAKASYGSIEFH